MSGHGLKGIESKEGGSLAVVPLGRVDTIVARLEKGFAQLLPRSVAVVAAAAGEADDLFDMERSLVAHAVEARRSEFAAGRWCARRALERVGGPAIAISRGPLFEPIWPGGFGGSITHESGIAVAAAHRTLAGGNGLRLGIDLIDCSDHTRFVEIVSVILSEQDRAVLAGRADAALAIAEIFSAKEAAVKILSTVIGSFIDICNLRVAHGNGGLLLSHPQSSLLISSRMCRIGSFLATVATASVGTVQEVHPAG